MNTPSVRIRIDAAIADWESTFGHKPDILYIGLREAYALDRELGSVTTCYRGLEVMMCGMNGLSLGRKYD